MFANDDVDAVVVEQLASLGVRVVALRCAGFNNVDLDATERHGLAVVHAHPTYATALSINWMEIPPVHYMIGVIDRFFA